ncbi:DUF881 domain-containing protein [Dethiothermospora halolimnae]|uniref:DUF881 domain-containing protein n=1 Tax=Dethiothermospora halolimnae TaxID=3114390 RepID=UPI003CCBD529
MGKKFCERFIILFMCIILGIFLVSNARKDNKRYEQVSLKTIENMKNEIINYREDISGIKKMIDKKEEQIKNYKKAIQEDGNIDKVLEEEIENIKFLSGMKTVRGPGVILTIRDNESDYHEEIDLNIVHDSDIQRIINDLKVAGAEAISISGQRLVSTSETVCGGPIIRINDHSSAVPFVIKAIGDPKTLNAAINAQGTFGWTLQDMYKIKIETIESSFIIVPAYSGDINFKYAEPLEEGE